MVTEQIQLNEVIDRQEKKLETWEEQIQSLQQENTSKIQVIVNFETKLQETQKRLD